MYVQRLNVSERSLRNRFDISKELILPRCSLSNYFAAILIGFSFAGSVIFHHFLFMTLSSSNTTQKDNSRYLLESTLGNIRPFLRRLSCKDTFHPSLHMDR